MVETTPSGQSSATYQLVDDSKVYQRVLVAGQEVEIIRLLASVFNQLLSSGKKIETLDPTNLVNLLSGDALANFFGVVLIKENETPMSLARVKDFVARGKEFLFGMQNGDEESVLVDFFQLNKPKIATLLHRFGIEIDDLTKTLSAMLNEALPAFQSSSPIDGVKTQQPSSGVIQSASSTSSLQS
jgi:hypothetical protein